MLFSYRAKTKDGAIIEDVMESLDKFSLSRELKSRGCTVLSIKESKKNSFNFNELFQNFFSKISTQEQIIFAKNLSGMIRAGLSLPRAISFYKTNKKSKIL